MASTVHVGGCFCGNCRVEYTGEPAAKAVCHCKDCRKITGSTFSTNIIVPATGNFKVTKGSPKEISKTADSGNPITSYFCPDCGTTLYRLGPSFGDGTVVKVGIMDGPNALAAAKPQVEFYSPGRVNWVQEVEEAQQKTKQ